jgi:hypothetical protein
MREATLGEIVAEDRPSTSQPGTWRAAASLAALLPAAAAAYGALSIFRAFEEMAREGAGGMVPVAKALYPANLPLLLASLLAMVLAAMLARTAQRHPERADDLPGLPFFLISVLAGIPVLLLWITESYPLDFLAGRVTGTIMEVSQRLQTLLFSTAAAALVVVVCALVAWARSRTSRPVPRVAIWAGAALLWLGVTVAFAVRTVYLVEAARGSL